MQAKYLWLVPLVLVLVTGVWLVSECIVTVKPGERAVVYNLLTKEYSEPVQIGFNFVLPKVNEVTIYKVRGLEYLMGDNIIQGSVPELEAIEVLSNDGLVLRIDLLIGYRLDASNLNELHDEIGSSYEDKVIRPSVRETFRTVFAEFSAIETNSREGRKAIQNRLDLELGAELLTYHIILEQLQIRNIKLPKEVEDAIEREKAARAEKEREVYKKQKAKQQDNEADATL